MFTIWDALIFCWMDGVENVVQNISGMDAVQNKDQHQCVPINVSSTGQ